MRYDAFLGGSYQAQAPTADVARTVNLYPENLQDQGATARKVLLPTPGVTAITTAVTGAGRAHFAMASREFYIIGNTLYEIDSTDVVTTHGTVAVDTNPATISSNGDAGNQLFITSGGNGYNFDLGTDTLTQIAALNGKATQGGYLDGYFIALDANTATIYISNLLDGTTWDTGTDFAQRSLAPDPWKAMQVVGRYVWLFGEYTTEIWQDTGARFPLAPFPGVLLNNGIAAPFSASIVGSDLVWLAQSRSGKVSVQRASGVAPQTISTYPLENQISGYVNFSMAISDSYSEAGHTFYMLNFDRAGITHAWDAETNEWCDRGTWDPDQRDYVAWRPRFYAFAQGEHRILDSSGGILYRMGADLTTDVDGLAIRRLRRAPAIESENKRIVYPYFELDLERGLGTSGQAEDPQVMLRISNDGGKTWGAEQWRSAGKTGEYSARVKWNRCGQGRRRVWEVAMTDPIAWKITGAYTEPAVEAA